MSIPDVEEATKALLRYFGHVLDDDVYHGDTVLAVPSRLVKALKDAMEQDGTPVRFRK